MREVASPDVGKMGIEILSFTIKDIFDNVEYLASLGRAQTANVKRDADIGVAEAHRDAGIRVSDLFGQPPRLWYSKICVKWPHSKRPQIGFLDQLSLNAGQKYCRILQREQHSTFIKPPFVIKIFVLSILEWPRVLGNAEPGVFFFALIINYEIAHLTRLTSIDVRLLTLSLLAVTFVVR